MAVGPANQFNASGPSAELLELTAKTWVPQAKDPLFGSGLIDVCRAAARLERTVTLCR